MIKRIIINEVILEAVKQNTFMDELQSDKERSS